MLLRMLSFLLRSVSWDLGWVSMEGKGRKGGRENCMNENEAEKRRGRIVGTQL